MLRTKFQYSDDIEIHPVQELWFSGGIIRDCYEARKVVSQRHLTIARIDVPHRSSRKRVLEEVMVALSKQGHDTFNCRPA